MKNHTDVLIWRLLWRDAMIRLKNISKGYEKTVISDVTLQIEKGTRAGLIGTNGSGKTTLLSIMAGNLKPDSGEVWYDGKNATKDSSLFSSCVGYVPQINPLIEELSVKDNLKLWYFDQKRRERLPQMLSLFRLEQDTDKKVSMLSGGMKKRLSIICSLADQPKILLLDEPTAALDIVSKAELLDCLDAYTKEGGTVFMTSHEEMEFAWFDEIYGIFKNSVEKLPQGTTVNDMVERLRKEADV